MSEQNPYNGILAIAKPTGMTSFDVIRRVKKILRMKKVGHGGTLDKAASGVLPILLGEATKLFDYLLIGQKEYVATIRFGAFTDTDDAEGSVIESFGDIEFDPEKIVSLLPKFRGEIEQIPPVYSALKINGKRSYQMARQNKRVEHRPRKVRVFEIFSEGFEKDLKEITLRIRCSSGTYIRSIARDLGQLSGWGAHLVALERTQSAGIVLSDCVSLDRLTSETVKEHWIPFNQALNHYPELELRKEPLYIRQGKPLVDECFEKKAEQAGVYRVVQNKKLIALVYYENKRFKYLRVFS